MAITRIGNIANTIPDNSIANSKFTDIVNFKNIIINGDMSIAQRGTSVSSYTSDAYSTVDRIKTRVGSLGTWTISQDTDVPSGQGFAKSLKWDCTTADAAPAASDYLILEQNIEGQNLQYLKFGTANAESLTLSFWVKSNKIGNYTVGLQCAGNNRHIESSYTINVSNTWEKKTITFAGDTTGVLANDNSEEMKLWFWLGGGSNYSSGTQDTSWSSYVGANVLVSGQVNLADNTANYINITGIQLEAGTSSSDFEFLPRPIVLQQCHRYYYKIQGGGTHGGGGGYAFIGNGVAITSTIGRIGMIFPVPMRAVPSINSGGTIYYEASSQTTLTSVATAIYSTAETGKLMFDNNLSGSVTVGSGGLAFTDNTNTKYIIFDSEL